MTLFVAVDHLDGLAAKRTPQHRGAAGFQSGFVHVEFVRIDRALHHGLAQAVARGDEYHLAEAGFRVHGEHHAGGTDVGAHHALDAGGERDLAMIESMMDAVGNGAVVE